jgi:hypothetical protein
VATKAKTGKQGGKPAVIAAPVALAQAATEPTGVNSTSASDTEFAAYITGQFQAHRGLGEAIALLKTRFKLTGDPDERSRINRELGELEETLQNIEADRTAFMAESLIVVPPSATDVEKLKGIADRLDEMIATSTSASAILQLAGELAGIWSQTTATN